MKITATSVLISLLGVSDAFVVKPAVRGGVALRMAEIGDTGVSFENVAREWRCKVCDSNNYKFALIRNLIRVCCGICPS